MKRFKFGQRYIRKIATGDSGETIAFARCSK